jgi:hypothetical protein
MLSLLQDRNQFLDWVQSNQTTLNYFFQKTPNHFKSLMGVSPDYIIPDDIPRFVSVKDFESKDIHKKNKEMMSKIIINIQYMMNAYTHVVTHDSLSHLYIDDIIAFRWLLKEFILAVRYPDNNPFVMCYHEIKQHLKSLNR